ncbi:MAG: glycerate kinase [Desulfohalobiaceae bacterium]|nr:glycerate kinase [Desulfohalobiaceae bacterium]
MGAGAVKIVFAFDSFKGSLGARQACEAAVAGWRSRRAESDVLATRPLADGGEGTAASVLACRDGEWVECPVWGPLGESRVRAGYAWFPNESEALVEMASASGLCLLLPRQYDPLRASTYGTGELIRAALGKNPERILLAVGGSATVDGGVGAATALGWRFLDAHERPLEPGGGSLQGLHRILQQAGPDLPPIEVLCDVDNPLLGPHGAAAVFGPQKGAGPAEVAALERGLARLSGLAKKQLGAEMDIPGGGAAGGLAAGASVFLGARLVPGISRIVSVSDLDTELRDADWVVTGEGSLDQQSLRGKVVSGVLQAAECHGVRVAVIAGRICLSEAEWRKTGISHALSLCDAETSIEEAVSRAPELIARRSGNLAEILAGVASRRNS